MRGTVAATDYGWYEFLRRRSLHEVNFWTPSDRRQFIAPQFSPFFFKLKAPHNVIGGFGYFAAWSSLPDWLAWESFEQGNGCSSLEEMRSRIGTIRQRIGYVATSPLTNIGCILIVEPTFFDPDDWIPQPTDWHPRIVTNKTYDLTTGEGRRIWEACVERATVAQAIRAGGLLTVRERGRYGTPRPVAPRLGQGTFRVAVTDAYDRACAVTGEHSLPALDAVHIQSYADDGPHDVRNGLLLRADLHRLFDKGYVTVTPDHQLEVSRRLRTDFQNGRSYYPLHGTRLHLPASLHERPALEFIQWHNERVFLG